MAGSHTVEIEKGNDATRLGRILSKNSRAVLGAPKLFEGTYLTTERETLWYPMETYFPGFDETGGRSDAWKVQGLYGDLLPAVPGDVSPGDG